MENNVIILAYFVGLIIGSILFTIALAIYEHIKRKR